MLRRRRYNYVTPTSYLELLSTFLKLLAEKRTEVTSAKKRLESGLDKLTSTANQVEDMQKELQELQPVLAATAKEVEDMMQVIAHDKEDAAQTKRTVEQQEREANEQAAVAKSIAGKGATTGCLPVLRMVDLCCVWTEPKHFAAKLACSDHLGPFSAFQHQATWGCNATW